MQPLEKAYQLERHFTLKVLFLLFFTTIIYGQDAEVCNSADDNACSWYILNTTQILQNTKDNIIVSPNNIRALLQRPPIIQLRSIFDKCFTNEEKHFEGENEIFIESEEKLPNPKCLENYYGGQIRKKSSTKTQIKILDDFVIKLNNVENFKVIVLNMFGFKEILLINFKYTLNITFYTRPDSIIVPAVETTESLRYLDSQILDAKILELPYTNEFNMYILLPHTKQGLNEMINNLGYEQLKRIQWMMEERRVNVILPTFNTNFLLNMREHIQKNSNHRFDVDFSTTFNVETKYTNFYQLTTLRFNGSGKAVKEDYSKTRSIKYEKFHVDRPFVFYIEKKKSDGIVCIGKVVNPIN